MPSFYITARKTTAITPVTVEAENREDAIYKVASTAEPGEEIEVLQVQELASDEAGGSTGATGATGSTGLSGASGASGAAFSKSKKTRAELNEMTKEELMALADDEDIDVNAHWSKADIVEAILKRK